MRLGRTQLQVTRLGLGTAPLAGLYEAVDERQAIETVAAAWRHGLRFFDTAPLYGHGLGEQRLGHSLRGRPRPEYVLATKVGRLLRADAPPESNQVYSGAPKLHPIFDFSYDGVMRSLEESRIRLGIDDLDVVHIHDPDDHFDEALSGAFRALDELRAAGVIGAVGAGMNQAEMLTRFAREASFDCFLLAGRYTLLDQTALTELLPTCLARGVAIIAAGVYNSGILADPQAGARYDYQPATQAVLVRAQRMKSVCERHGVPLRAAAIQFPLGHPAVQAVVIGCRSAAQLEDSIRMFETPVPADLWNELKSERLLAEGVPTPPLA
ncbi:MAG TPA: aldo/keto reductase [Casimicrobiaceae bacterium]|nr:aldo/keto reductase [Casimicrobiaceae bacterium]